VLTWAAAALAGALRCQQATKPEKVAQAIYEYARAAALDPAKGGIADPKTRQDIDKYVRTVYTNFHGSGEGLDQLKQLAVQSPLPPADFKLKTASEIAAEKEAEFAKSNPQLTLWMGVRAKLSDAAGDQGELINHRRSPNDAAMYAIPTLWGKSGSWPNIVKKTQMTQLSETASHGVRPPL